MTLPRDDTQSYKNEAVQMQTPSMLTTQAADDNDIAIAIVSVYNTLVGVENSVQEQTLSGLSKTSEPAATPKVSCPTSPVSPTKFSSLVLHLRLKRGSGPHLSLL